VLGAAVFAFITSWDEVIMVIFIGGVTATTLPLKMFSYLRTEINPTIAAVSTLLIAGVTLAFLLGGPVGRRLRAVGARTSSKRWA
jgi:putative spermidine/putrescine transport system permease protein